jgi:Protein of unknown function (DUF2786)
MGKNNRARRAAKAKAHRSGHYGSRHHGAHHHADPAQRSDGPGGSAREVVRELIESALFAATRGPNGPAVAPSIVAKLAALPMALVDAEFEGQLRRLVTVLWSNGWQPLELVRQVRRATSATGGRLSTVTVLADHATRHPETLHPAWAEQITALREAAGHPAPADGSWLAWWGLRESQGRQAVIATALGVGHAMLSLGRIEQLLPPPGNQDGAGTRRTAHVAAPADSPILAKVRALLAQAESTTFPAEADAFTAKAQELMTRYAIDHAVLHGSAPGEQPMARRIAIDEPYLEAKSFLLHVVTEHNRTKSVFHQHYAFSTVVGFEADLAATDLLFTSLLVQAQTALSAEGRTARAGDRTRSRSFRSSFLVAFADRIGHRLADINQSVLRDIEPDAQRSALPVLAARRHEVDERVDAMFPALQTNSISAGWDGMGALRGRMAADAAQLSYADLPRSAAG